jgi:hypothetical protein
MLMGYPDLIRKEIVQNITPIPKTMKLHTIHQAFLDGSTSGD